MTCRSPSPRVSGGLHPPEPPAGLVRLDAADVALVTGIIAGQVSLAAGPAAAPPEWLKVTPRGRVTTRDGRSFTFDPAVLAARFASDGIDIPVDADHSTVLLGGQGLAPTTLGYASAVEARDDGTYAKVDWNEAGRATLAARTHRYVSPTIHPDGAGRVTWLHSVALVSAPALTMPAVLAAAAALHATQGSPMLKIAQALGLAETATEAQCLAALAGLTPVRTLAAALGLSEGAGAADCLAAAGTLRAGAGDAGTIANLQAQLATTSVQLAAIVTATRDKEVKDLFDGALRERRMVPAERDSLAKLCATDDGLANVRALLASRAPALGASGLDGRTAPGADKRRDPVKLAAEAQALVDKSSGTLNIADAVMQLTKD